MFLQDFDLTFIHTPGTAMGTTNTLSHLPNPDVSSDNTDVTLLPDNLFIYTINTALADKLTSSSVSDLLTLDTVKCLSQDSPLFPCSSVADWHFDGSYLYFKHHHYIPLAAHHNLIA